MSVRMIRAAVIGSFLCASALAPGLASAQATPPSQGTKPAGQAPRPPGDQPKSAAQGSPDSSFIHEAAEGGMKEVELGKLAQSHASDSNVKVFAQRMITDHGKANKELMSLAKSKGISLPPSHPATTTAAHKPASGATGTTGSSGTGATSGTSGAAGAHKADDLAQLAALKGAEFDRAYMSNMVEDHEKDVKAFEQEAQSGQDPEVKAWAAKHLPTLREHLTQAKSVQDKLGADK